MSFSVRPQPWCTPIGLLAVIGPSMNDHRSCPLFFSRSFLKASVSLQKSRTPCSIFGKSSLLSTGLNIVFSILTHVSRFTFHVSLSVSQHPHRLRPRLPVNHPGCKALQQFHSLRV